MQSDLKIKDLRAPVTAAKSDWQPSISWTGFTPAGSSMNAKAKRESGINKQFGKGYIIEYITQTSEKPNPGFENSPEYLKSVENHAKYAGRLIAVHRLQHSALPLLKIIGDEQYNKLQDMWSRDKHRARWSVSFPIVESYSIPTLPKANTVLSKSAMQRLFGYSSMVLRPLNDEERLAIAELPLIQVECKNEWIAYESDFSKAERSEIEPELERMIDDDMLANAMEGMEEEKKVKIKRRAAWLAQKFVIDRGRAGKLFCDECGFDPKTKVGDMSINPRTLLDVHHKDPIAEGVRFTTSMDFALLCPTCHRLEHALMRVRKKN